MKREFSYVLSAPSMLSFQPTEKLNKSEEEYQIYHSIINHGITKIKNDVKKEFGDNIKLCLLFNAFTEKAMGEYIHAHHDYHFEKLYSDSGGLQVITRNKQVTLELKKRVYETQKSSDYAFCFDEIPLNFIEGVEVGGRSSINEKIFNPIFLKEKAIKTARNIKEQTEHLMDVDTKVFYIVQGNNQYDMVDWFRHGIENLNDDNIEKLQGISLADTCIGNGVTESIEMMLAYMSIRSEFGEEVTKNHVHFLGVGSPMRTLPLVMMAESGLFSNKVELSIDSTTLSMVNLMGNWQGVNGDKVLNDDRKLGEVWHQIYTIVEPVLVEMNVNFTRGEFVEHFVQRKDSVSRMHSETKFYAVCKASLGLMGLSHVVHFFRKLNKLVEHNKRQKSILYNLSLVSDEKDLLAWKREFIHKLGSKRIARYCDSYELSQLFV